MKVEFFHEKGRHGRLTKKEAFAVYPTCQKDIEKEIAEFKTSNCPFVKISYPEGLGAWMEK